MASSKTPVTIREVAEAAGVSAMAFHTFCTVEGRTFESAAPPRSTYGGLRATELPAEYLGA